ncbi:hypothetical protein [Luteitalea sp. TBR-22]|uniref:hypothetical protein n=1 Tax=Luteitalea sp. TBR-22 TaxID=2802971 RepID=UPI001EF5EE23|nr:hypothetical protein [Luteitalea sp. TBR-22]
MRTILTALLIAALTTVLGAESPAAGAWKFTMNSPMGTVEAKVDLKVEGETLKGSFDLGGGRVWPIESGTIKGDAIAFVITRERPSGGTMAYEMKGTVKGEAITGDATAMGNTVEWSMVRPK